MKRTFIFLLVTPLLSFQCVLFGQSSQESPYEDSGAYEVYSAILNSPGATGSSKIKGFVIRQETLRNFGALEDAGPDPYICLRPDETSKKLIGSAIEDYIKVNKTKWTLQEKFKLDMPYQLVPSAAISPLIAEHSWEHFYKKFPDSGGFIDLSAVGFNADKSVAVATKGRWCGGLCGEGEYHVLQKQEGKWVPLQWEGERCGWIS